MKLKTLFLKLAVLGMMLWPTGCAHVSPVPAASLYPVSGILRLQTGETYRAQANETWHSAARYQQLELQLLDSVSALKQTQSK
jgi:hypothetical protein